MSLRIKMLSLFALTSLLLVGCGDKPEMVTASTSNDEETEHSVYELEVLPPSVRNGIVSEDVYFDIKYFLDESVGYVGKLTAYQEKVIQDKTKLYDDIFVDEYINTINDFTAFMESIQIDPETDADIELNESLPKIIDYGLKANNSLKLFVETQEPTYFENYREHFDDYSNYYSAFVENFYKYEK